MALLRPRSLLRVAVVAALVAVLREWAFARNPAPLTGAGGADRRVG